MDTVDFVTQHILDSLNAAMAEANGHEQEANRLHAQTRLRLLTMSDDELWELAKLTTSPPDRPIEQVHQEIRQAIEEHRSTSHEWVGDLHGVACSANENSSGNEMHTFDTTTEIHSDHIFPET